MENSTTSPTRRRLLQAAGASLIAPAVASVPRVARADEPVTLTLWSWTPHVQDEITMFEQAHPNIKVNYVNAGQGIPHYTKMRTAIKAGVGLPDVAQVEFYMQPTFRLVNALADIAPYGADKIAGDYIPWTWEQVSENGKVYGIPWDSGPVGLLYREDIFDKHKITPPKTWDEYADSAMRLSKEAPDVFLGDIMLNNTSWMYGSFWQAGWNPFHVDGTNISIAVNDAAAKRVASYWQKLIDAKASDIMPSYTSEWFTAFDKGRFATWFIAAWGPTFLSQFAKNSTGLWRAAAAPQWDAGKTVSANMGGSTLAVTTQSKHPKEAAELAMWLLHDPSAQEVFVQKQFLFPTLKSVLNSESFANTTNAFYGDQKVNAVFIESAKYVDRVIAWAPFMDYVNAQFIAEMSAAGSGQGTLVQALDRVQDNLVKFAKAQGFTMKV
jgi:multiple sugar transport system substrate-binding protein